MEERCTVMGAVREMGGGSEDGRRVAMAMELLSSAEVHGPASDAGDLDSRPGAVRRGWGTPD
jgi:hypothetical protein